MQFRLLLIKEDKELLGWRDSGRGGGWVIAKQHEMNFQSIGVEKTLITCSSLVLLAV